MTLLFLMGTWPIALILLTALIIFIVKGVNESNSGSVTGGNFGNPRREWKKNVPYHKTTSGIFSLMLLAVTIAYFIWVVTTK